MSNEAVAALDVGGTTVDAACVSASGEVIGEVLETASPAAKPKDAIVAALASAIGTARAQAGGRIVTACCVAIPAPFDYAAGVSHMTHKFRAIRGVALGELLAAETGLRTWFVNDAAAFGLGVGWRQLPDTKRFVALTIGTGLGSSFIENSESIEDDDRVPADGEVWNLPFGDGILEDYVSARGVTAWNDKLRPDERLSAKDVSDLALRGDATAIEVYRKMGTALGQGLAPVLARFAPEKIVIGGKVGQSLDLFRPAMEQALAEAGLPEAPELPILPSAPGNMAILGAARYALTRSGQRRGC